MLRLRALRGSGDFDHYWAFHRRREVERNHLVHYAANELPGHPRVRSSELLPQWETMLVSPDGSPIDSQPLTPEASEPP